MGDGKARMVILAFFLIMGTGSMKAACADSVDLLRPTIPLI